MTESKLAKFVEDIIVPPKMVDIIVDGEVYLYPFLFSTSFLLANVICNFFFPSIINHHFSNVIDVGSINLDLEPAHSTSYMNQPKLNSFFIMF